MSKVRAARALVTLVSLVTIVPLPAYASPDPDAMRIQEAGHSLKWNWTPPGETERFGHAETLVHAPLATVRAQVLDFAHYKEFNSKFKQSRVVGTEKGNTDVYMQVSVLHGMVSLWNVTRFTPPKQVAAGTEQIEGRSIRGNVKESHVMWTLRAVDSEWTVVKCDILLKPDFPAPQAALDEELRDSAQNAVDGVHKRAQGNGQIGPYAAK